MELNDTFSNQAEFYFDYNAPIITNEYSTTVSENLEVEDISDSSQKITLFPNPAHEFFKVKVGETIIKVEVFDVQGRVVKTYSGEHDNYNIGTLTTRVYSVKVRTENQTYYSQLIVK